MAAIVEAKALPQILAAFARLLTAGLVVREKLPGLETAPQSL